MTGKNGKAHRGRIVYFSHGGGPLPILGEPGHRAMVDFMEMLPSQLDRPEAIVVVSAHWEENEATALGASAPSMLYDYYGFPEAAYSFDYPAPGHPGLAGRIAGLLQKNGMPARTDPQRGFDHGLYIPLMLIYPDAGIPAVQLSLIRGLDPAAHIALGKALGELAHENILVIGSGFSFHNMGAFSWDGTIPPDAANDTFQDWLIETCSGPVSRSQREERLIGWETAPSARYCHPREEHLLPLHVCVGMAGRPATVAFDAPILGKRAVAFLW